MYFDPTLTALTIILCVVTGLLVVMTVTWKTMYGLTIVSVVACVFIVTGVAILGVQSSEYAISGKVCDKPAQNMVRIDETVYYMQSINDYSNLQIGDDVTVNVINRGSSIIPSATVISTIPKHTCGRIACAI